MSSTPDRYVVALRVGAEYFATGLTLTLLRTHSETCLGAEGFHRNVIGATSDRWTIAVA